MTSTRMNKVKAVVLAGGKGTRLWPLTAVFPKPLVPLGNKSVLEILLRQLYSFGLTFTYFPVIIRALSEKIRSI